MGDGFAKLYGDKLLRSTLWLEPPEARLVFVSMLAIADKDGLVDIPGVRVLANVLNLDLAYVERALAILEAPDPDSRSPEHEGRRLLRVEGGGWRCVNYAKYRDYRTAKQEATRQRVAKHRSKSVTRNAVTPGNPGNAPEAEAEAEAEAHTRAPLRPSWVCVVREFEASHPWAAGLLDAQRQKPHAESIWKRLGEDVDRVRSACEAHAADTWVAKEKASLSHLASKLEKYADNGTAAAEAKGDAIARLRRERSGYEVGASLGDEAAKRAIARIDAAIAEVSA